MKPGVTVRSERSITRAPGGRPTDRSILAIRLPSTRISAGPVSASESHRTRCRRSEQRAHLRASLRRLILPHSRRQTCAIAPAACDRGDANRGGWRSGGARSRGAHPRSSPRSGETAARCRSPPRPHRPGRRRRKDRRAARWESRPARISRAMPPPIPVSMPRSAAMTGLSPKASAFCAPETAKSASPAPSNTSTGLLQRSTHRDQQKVITPARSETARYRQSLIAAGGIAPIRRSRVMPPTLPAANDKTRTPKRSSRRLIPSSRTAQRKDKGSDEIEYQQERLHSAQSSREPDAIRPAPSASIWIRRRRLRRET